MLQSDLAKAQRAIEYLADTATFNINNINKRLQNLLAWLAASKPDVVCLQELKSAQADFPAESLQNIGYEAVWYGQRSWNGVAILARGQVPVLTRSDGLYPCFLQGLQRF